MQELDYTQILKIIYAFYDKAKRDFMIGYHFRFIEDFDEHIPRIAHFWQLQLTGIIQDKSQLPFKLLEVHKALNVKKGEVGRWVTLFEQTLDEQKVDLETKKVWMKKVHLFADKIISMI